MGGSGGGALAVGARRSGILADARPSGALGRAPQGAIEKVLEQRQALQSRHVGDRSVNLADLLSTLGAVTEQVDRQGINLLLGLDAGPDGRPEGVKHRSDEP